MQVTETGSEKLRREFTVVVPKNDFENRVAEKLEEVGQTVSIPGFRPGKVPMSVLKMRFGKAARVEALQTTVQETAQRAMEERELRPAMDPVIDVVTDEDGADLEYKLTVDVLPDIPPLDFAAIELERMVVDLTDEKIEENLGGLAETRRTYACRPGRPAVAGDQLMMDYVGRIDGEAFEGSSAEGLELLLGRGQLFSEFDEQLVGMVAGDTREVKVSFSDDRFVDDLRGKEAVFEVKIVEVREPEPVPVDDSLAKSMGYESLAELRDAIRSNQEREYQRVSRGRLKQALFDRLSEIVDFEVPPGPVEKEFKTIWRDVEHAREHDALDVEDKEKSEEELRETYMNIARRRIRMGLLMADVVASENLTVSDDELRRQIAAQINALGARGGAEMMELYRTSPAMGETLRASLLEDKAVDYILELAQVTDRSVAENELSGEPDAPTDQEGAVA